MSEFKCTKCGKEFETQQALNGHNMTCKKKVRRKRTPIGGPSLKMAVEIPDGKVARWVSDDGDRLSKFQAADYEFVTAEIKVGEGDKDNNTDLGSMKSMVVGKGEAGKPIRGYLMMIDKELYEEDQAAKMEQIAEIDNDIKNGTHNEKSGDGRYVPKEGITYTP